MKISRLYIKYFIIVMVIVISSHFLILQLFRFASSRTENTNRMNDFNGLAYLLSDTVRTRVDNPGITEDERNTNLSAFLADFGRKWSADIWIENEGGNVIAAGSRKTRSAFGELPRKYESFRLSEFGKRTPHMEMVIPVDTKKGKLVAYVQLYRERRMDKLFIEGLAIISFLVLVVMFPLSRRITNPLNRLTESANAISRGEFSIHVDDSSSDEIGTLARAFNRMRGQILLMIHGTKELTANISHQIRSPLARINVAVELLRGKLEKGDSAGALVSLESIERETEEIDGLTGRIIELIRADIAHRSDDYEKMDLRDIIAEIASRYGERIAARNCSFVVNTDEEPVIIYGIPRDIAELVDIIIENACRYSPQGGAILVEATRIKGESRLLVTNGSRAISGEEAERILKPFTRGKDEKTHGYGLGLAIAQRIVENHRGRIIVEPSEREFRISVTLNSENS